MKVEHTERPIPRIDGAKVAIVRTKWYAQYVDNLVKHCRQQLAEAGCVENIEEHVIPGAVELPLAVQTLIHARPGLDAVICFGGIVKGQTYHFEMIANECMRGLGEIMLREKVPIIVEVIPVFHIADLAARAADDNNNKGIEAAYAAAEIVAWRRSVLAAELD
jgi:6,7-dimethyl-8-ribityllumazine synthase